MSSDRRLLAADEERRHVTHEHTSPTWRIVGLGLGAGSIVAFGYYLQTIGYAHYFATVVVIASFEAVRIWAKKKPDRLRRRVGPAAPLAAAIRETGENLERLTDDLPLRVGFGVGALKGVGVVIAQSVVVAGLAGLYSWHLAVAGAAAVGAVAAAPEMFRGLRERLALPDEDEPEGVSAGDTAEDLDETGRSEVSSANPGSQEES